MTHEEMTEWFACQVCGKPAGLNPVQCHATVGRERPSCRESRQCRIMEKSEEQLTYGRSAIDENIFLKACPGSGKTEVVGLKAASEIRRWSRRVGGIAVLTFTNNAANVIHERVCQFAGIEKANYPHFIGTLDSWLHKYIAQSFGHRVMGRASDDGDKSIRLVDERADGDDDGWLNTYKLRTPYVFFKKDRKRGVVTKDGVPVLNEMPLFANMIRFDHQHKGWELRVPVGTGNEFVVDVDYYESPEFIAYRSDKSWLTLARMQAGFKEIKSAFHTKGFATYQDIENICYELLSGFQELAQRVAGRFPLLIIDECQDLSWIQLQILKVIMDAGSHLHLVGDLNQAIYEFKKVSPEDVRLFVGDGFTKMELSHSFRGCQKIVDTCKALVSSADSIKGMCQPKIESPCLFIVYKRAEISLLPARFESLLREKGVDPAESAIVARGRSTISKLRPSGHMTVDTYPKWLAMAVHLWKAGGFQALGDALKYMGRFIARQWFPKCRWNAREYYCPDCVDSCLRWRRFLAEVLRRTSEDACIANLEKTWSTWAQSVRTYLPSIVRGCRPMLAGFREASSSLSVDIDFRFIAPRGTGSLSVLKSLETTPQDKTGLRITTIHAVKGETLDAVMLVSSPSNTGGNADGHWRQWLADRSSEAARFAYVASSRPRHLLVWAVPEEKDCDYHELRDLGLVRHPVDGKASGGTPGMLFDP